MTKKNLLSFLTLVLCFVLLNAKENIKNYNVYLNDDESNHEYSLLSKTLSTKLTITEDINENGLFGSFPIVVSRFEDSLLEKGWGILDIETSNIFHDGIQAYAAGYAEGFVTAHHIYTMSKNVASTLFKDINQRQEVFNTDDEIEPMPDILIDFLTKQEEWTYELVQEQIADEISKDYDFYFHVGLIMEQLDGMIAGYEEKRVLLDLPELPRWAFLMLNANGDLDDLIAAYIDEANIDFFNIPLEEAVYEHGLKSSCSAIVKVLPGNEDLLMGHNSWFYFTFTNRIFKHYNLNFQNRKTAAKGVSFSSYPGFLESLDDFYMLSSGISWTQTSNKVLNKTVYDLTPKSLLAWQRVRVASAMSFKGSDFLKYMKKHFSGTYANQYIVVDYNLFTPNRPLKDNTLWIVEEMAGLIVGADKTDILRFGYWPSYNVPYFPEVFERSGYGYMEEKFASNRFSHSLATRAEIFRNLESKVTDLDSLKHILRYNDYENDKYSQKNPASSLCSRYDLIEDQGTVKKKPYGCYDAKVTSYNSGAMKRKAEIISGPTSAESFGAEYINPFTWKEFDAYSHEGLPETYEFKFMKTQPFYSSKVKEVKYRVNDT